MATKCFGSYIRRARLALQTRDPRFSLRQVAQQIDVEPSFLSKVERGVTSPPSETKIVRLAHVLTEDPDVLLALAGRISTDLQEVIRQRPQLFAELIRLLKHAPDQTVARYVKEARGRYSA